MYTVLVEIYVILSTDNCLKIITIEKLNSWLYVGIGVL